MLTILFCLFVLPFLLLLIAKVWLGVYAEIWNWIVEELNLA